MNKLATLLKKARFDVGQNFYKTEGAGHAFVDYLDMDPLAVTGEGKGKEFANQRAGRGAELANQMGLGVPLHLRYPETTRSLAGIGAGIPAAVGGVLLADHITGTQDPVSRIVGGVGGYIVGNMAGSLISNAVRRIQLKKVQREAQKRVDEDPQYFNRGIINKPLGIAGPTGRVLSPEGGIHRAGRGEILNALLKKQPVNQVKLETLPLYVDDTTGLLSMEGQRQGTNYLLRTLRELGYTK